MSEYDVQVIERDGYVGRISVMEYPDMPDFDGDGHIITIDYFRGRTEVENVDCQRTGEAEDLASALSWAYERWGFDWEKIERYLRSFYDVTSFDFDHWDRDRHIVAVATRGLAAEGWGNPDGEVNLGIYKAYRDGEVYGYTVESEDGLELVDSCWGYYGLQEVSYLEKVVNDLIDDRVRERHEAAVAMYARMVNRTSRN